MGILGFGSPYDQQTTQLLGLDPAAMRRQALFNGIAAAGFTLMGNPNLGAAGGAFLQGTNQGRDDYMQNAMLGYKMKAAADDRAFNRQWQQDERNYQRGRDKIGDARQAKADAWQNTQNQHTLDQWQQAEDLRQGHQNAVGDWMQNYAQQGGTLPFSPEVRGLARQGGVTGVDATDQWRYGQMQPYAAANDYENAFTKMTDTPPIPKIEGIAPGSAIVRNGEIIGTVPKQPEPTNDQREYAAAVAQGYQGTLQDWILQGKKAGASQVNVNGGGSDTQIFNTTKEQSDAAKAAQRGLSSLSQAQQALPGAITGAGAEQRLALQKIGALLGVGDTQSIVDTETFRSAIAPQVAAMLKATVGSTQISNADREFAEKAAAGSIQLDGNSIARLINIMQAANSDIIRNFNSTLDQVYPEEQGYARERALFGVPNVPVRYAAPIGPQAPNRGAATPAPRVRKYNPATGRIE